MSNKDLTPIEKDSEDTIKTELDALSESTKRRVFSKLIGAALGTIPWVGGFLSAAESFKSESSQVKKNELYEQWLQEHSKKIENLRDTLIDIVQRLNEFSEEIDERIESEEYLNIVRKGFRAWDYSDTSEKRDLIRKLLTNAGAYKLVPDDLISLFLDWINLYHETHFAVIKVIFQNPRITRFQIWQKLNGARVREDSLEADLFKLLIRDLSMGSVIRQARVIDYEGNFFKKSPQRGNRSSSTYKSAFDNEEVYELTELGKQFVHYTMNEVVSRIN